MAGTFRVDSREQDRYLRKFTAKEADKVLRKATTAGATAARKVMVAGAPFGISRRPSQFYRSRGAAHGQFAASIQSKAVRKRGIQAKTIANVIGPMGPFGFTRAWRESGTKPHGKHPGSRGTRYVERTGPLAFEAAQNASEAALVKYAQSKT